MSTESRIRALERKRGATGDNDRAARFLIELIKRPLPDALEPPPEWIEAVARGEADGRPPERSA